MRHCRHLLPVGEIHATRSMIPYFKSNTEGELTYVPSYALILSIMTITE